eukprot:CAMPEP_0197235954 /NCGR_PEP_ID=MMETSP1429-20130617/3242_1 /TAXON_ID=49237 /ORGANISM="Chaetoceros  sp., Strain UNC1202" /LENGTH=262 /DNA_ID=CAMNT_0042694677 /DNA_START=97 /DNA_END=885 /DNA_ORIENTATION=+
MKVKKMFLTIALFIAALASLSFLSSIPAADAARAYRRWSPCSTRSCRTRPSGWDVTPSCHHSHYDRRPFFDQMSKIFSAPITLNSLFEQQHRQVVNMQRSAPRYDISEDDRKVELAFDLPGVRPEDVSLELQQDGTVLKVSGYRKYRQHGQIVTTEFDQMFTIDDSLLDVKKISAKVSNGVLLISAPKIESKVNAHNRKIPIKENKVAAVEEVKVDINVKGKGNTASEVTPKVVIPKKEKGEVNSLASAVEGLEISEEEDIA